MKTWTTGEVAKRRNISVRTLRYYDEINLLKPTYKEEHGKRLYTEEDLFTLEKIIILKSLSLPLKKIRQVMEEFTYKEILESHYNFLQEERVRLEENIAHTATLIHMAQIDETLSWESVLEIVRNSEKSPNKWIDYFTKEDQSFLQEKLPNISNNDQITQQFITILNTINQCIKKGIAPESEEGVQVISELLTLSEGLFAGNEQLAEEFWEIRKLPAEETGLVPISDDVFAFIEKGMAHIEENT